MYSITNEFRRALGAFHATWASVEITMDWAIGQFLKLPQEETHLITAGMEFGRKAVLLRALVARSDSKNKNEILQHLNWIQNESKRNAFAHSFMRSNKDVVTFVKRSGHGKFEIREHSFQPKEFDEHVNKFIEAAIGFEKELGATRKEIESFAQAATNLASKS